MSVGRVIVLGSINLDIQLFVAALPRPGETVPSQAIRRGLGGKGANQAIAASLAGAPAMLRGAIGGEAGILDLLRDAAPDLDIGGVTALPGAETGTAYILVSQGGENQIVTAEGANAQLYDHGDLTIRAEDVCLAPLEVPVPAILRFFAAARSVGARTVLNAAPPLDEGRMVFPHTDVLVVNETELAHYAGQPLAPGDDLDALAAMAGAFRKQADQGGDQTVIVTLGANGVLVLDDGSVHIPGRPARPIDTTGAGDCFCGVLCAALADGADIRAAAALANVAASLQVERPGAATAMPGRAEITAAARAPT